jgi:hypothetical protein
VFDYLKTTTRAWAPEQSVPTCLKTSAAFHLLNMAKLKMAYKGQFVGRSEYFERQASFSLSRHWEGLDVAFIDQILECQDLHQSQQCPSIGVAYIAFEQFDSFRSLYPLHRELELSLEGFWWSQLPLLTAALGVAECRKYSHEAINIRLLESLLRACNPASQDARSREESHKRVSIILREFLDYTVPPLVDAYVGTSTDRSSWTTFFNSSALQHMRRIAHVFMQSSHSAAHGLFDNGCPVSSGLAAESLWNFLKTGKESLICAGPLETNQCDLISIT